MLRIPHCLDNRLIQGGKVASPKQRPRSTSQKHFSAPDTHFCQRLSKPQGHGTAGEIRLKEKKKKLCGLSPQANYTDQATAACRRS
jgi:hypothetical protein